MKTLTKLFLTVLAVTFVIIVITAIVERPGVYQVKLDGGTNNVAANSTNTYPAPSQIFKVAYLAKVAVTVSASAATPLNGTVLLRWKKSDDEAFMFRPNAFRRRVEASPRKPWSRPKPISGH